MASRASNRQAWCICAWVRSSTPTPTVSATGHAGEHLGRRNAFPCESADSATLPTGDRVALGPIATESHPQRSTWRGGSSKTTALSPVHYTQRASRRLRHGGYRGNRLKSDGLARRLCRKTSRICETPHGKEVDVYCYLPSVAFRL